MSTPYIGFGNDTLAKQPDLKEGDLINCPNCKGQHLVEVGTDANTGKKSDTLMFYRCGEQDYLAGVSGKLVAGLQVDVSGRL